MMSFKGKKLVLCFLSLILCVTACGPAFASAGDRVLLSRNEENPSFYMRSVVPYGENGFCVFVQHDREEDALVYTDYKAEPETFTRTVYEEDTRNYWMESLNAEDSAEAENAAEEGNEENEGIDDDENFFADDDSQEERQSQEGENVYDYFTWNNEIYALVNKWSSDGEESKEETVIKHVKLEDGQIILEEENVPELDMSGMVDSDTGNPKFYGTDNIVAVGDNLFMTYYGETGVKLLVYDMNSGDYTEGDMEDVSEIAPGPDGSLLVTRDKWGEDEGEYDKVKITLTRLDPATLNEEPLSEITVKGTGRINPCYDAETDTLYYIANGELWAMPQFDVEKAVAVNDCPDNGNGMMMLKDGFVLVRLFSYLLVKNTDPTQRGSIQLRVKGGGSNTITEAIYDMNNTRGDISVISETDWTFEQDIVQSLMNRDAHTDIYMLGYQSNEFSAIYNHEYLVDLSSNEKIAAATARMYPYIQDAVKKDGKILAVPVSAYGGVLGVNTYAMKMMGMKEEELPHTWSQFFDWMEELPAKMADVQVKIAWEDRMYLRTIILEAMIEQYELWMQKKGDNEYAFNNPILCDLIKRLNNLDYEGLKAREHVEYNEDNEDDYYYDDGGDDDNMVLMESYISTTMSNDGDFIPLLLSFTDDEEPVVPVELQVAFVNPYSEHPQEAMEFLGCLLDNLELEDQYTMYTDKKEPIRYNNQDTSLTMIQETIDACKAKIEKAEGEQKVNLEERLKELEAELEQQERWSWRIGPERIERYQQRTNQCKVRSYSFYNALWGSQNNNTDEDEPSPYETIFASEESMKMAPEELLGMLDSKVQMMRLEGN